MIKLPTSPGKKKSLALPLINRYFLCGWATGETRGKKKKQTKRNRNNF